MKAGSIFSLALALVVMLASMASAQKMQVAVVLSEPTNEYFVVALMFDGTPVDPDWPHDPGDEIQGLAGLIFDIVPSGGLVIESAESTAPQDYPMGFWLWNYATHLPNGAVGINAFQATVLQMPQYVWEGVGLPPYPGENPPWDFPVLLASGTYSGTGGLGVEFLTFSDPEENEWTYVSVLYGDPVLGWFDPAKVDAFRASDVLTYSATTTQ